MEILSTRQKKIRRETRDGDQPHTLTLPDGKTIKTWSTHRLAEQWQDRDLTRAIAWCRAVEPRDRPSLGVLLDLCQHAVDHRNENYYKNFPAIALTETDANVDAFVRDFILNPPYGQQEFDEDEGYDSEGFELE